MNEILCSRAPGISCRSKILLKSETSQYVNIPAVVILQSLKVWVHDERILRVWQNKVGIPVQTLLPVLCRADSTPVRPPISQVTVIGSYGGGIWEERNTRGDYFNIWNDWWTWSVSEWWLTSLTELPTVPFRTRALETAVPFDAGGPVFARVGLAGRRWHWHKRVICFSSLISSR